MKLNYEKYMKKLYALINACEAPACISEEMADDIYEDVADTEAENKTLRHDLSEERKTTKTLSVALAEIYRTVYGYEPSALFPLEGTLENIQKQIENMKRRSKAFSGSLVGPSKEESTIKYLEQCIRHIHSKLKCPDSDVKDIEALFEEISIRTSSLIEIMKASFNDINGQVDKTTDSELLDKERETLEWRTESIREIAEQLGVNYLTESVKHAVLEIKAEIERREKDAYIELRQVGKLRIEQDNAKKHILELTGCLRGEPFAGDISSLTLEEVIDLLSVAIANKLPAVPAGELEEAIERIYNSQYTSKIPSMSKSQLDRLCTRIEDITKWNKAVLVKTGRLEREIARLNYQTSKLRFTENSALEKKAEVWAIKAIEYRVLLSTVERRLRGMWTPEPAAANTVSMSDVEDMADLIAEGIGKS